MIRKASKGMGPLVYALTGVLIATSLVNSSTSGVPVFYLLFILPIFAAAFPDSELARHSGSWPLGMLVLVGGVATALIATTLLQVVIVHHGSPTKEVVHLLSRLSFLAYFLVIKKYVQGKAVFRTLVWIRSLLIVVCLYGAYQVPAKLAGLPLFLDWLRNNQSFFSYDYDTGGWIGLVRATSIFAEPAQATIPILVLFILNIQIKTSRLSTIVGWVSLLLFTAATFSRGAWIALGAAGGIFLISRSARLSRLLPSKRGVLLAGTLIFLLILPLWGFLRPDESADLSAQERSGSIVLGLNMIKDAPILGSGWNSFNYLAPQYGRISLDTESSINFEFIHNMVVSYVQQAGIAGLALAALPFMLLIGWSTAPRWAMYCTLASFLLAAETGGDVGYCSLTWLWIALMVNMRGMEAATSATVVCPQPVYKPRMSVLPQPTS